MADTVLTPTGLVQVEVGASRNTWGAKWNVNVATVNVMYDDVAGAAALKIANGGTGAVTAAGARTALGAQPASADLTAIAALTSAADKVPYATGAGTWALATFTAAGRALVDDADASAQLTTLGVSAYIKTLVDDADAPTARATLGAEPQGEVFGFNAYFGSTATLVLADKGKHVWLQPATSMVVTIPPNSSVAFPVGTRIDLAQSSGNSGGVSIAPGAGVTLTSYNSNRKLQGVGAAACLVKNSADSWWLFGQLVA